MLRTIGSTLFGFIPGQFSKRVSSTSPNPHREATSDREAKLSGNSRWRSKSNRTLNSRGREVADGVWDTFICISHDGPVFKDPY